ncbi:MAG: DUF523 domain-containing protein [Clostridiales bacterium]|nr:DUF523 domain-containing protein [Clostridiales bacterium]
MILVSACLLGINCKYDGSNNLAPKIIERFEEEGIVPVCPEQLGGLATPRNPAEILNGTGKDVLDGKARVYSNSGKDVTASFLRGAIETTKIAKKLRIHYAILKSNSPSCASKRIYDGTFSSSLVEGNGVTVALLKCEGVRVYSEKNYVDILTK